jgi:FkbM family methyltransferase
MVNGQKLKCLSIIHLFKKEHIVIEVGSHIGSFTVPIAKLAKSVFSFEPQRTVFQVLNTNLIINNIHNVYSYMNAVGKEEKLLWLKEIDYQSITSLDEGFNSGGIHLKQISAENNGYPCKQITLDSFIPKEAKLVLLK